MDYNLDFHKLHLWPHEVTKPDPTPITVELSLTSYCNQKCFFCPFLGCKGEHIPETIVSFGNGPYKPKSVTIAGVGEPTMHWNFREIVRRLSDNNIKLGLMTNGTSDISDVAHLFVWIRFSINAGLQESYGFIHGVKEHFWKVWENLHRCVTTAPETDIGVQCLLLPQLLYKDYNNLIERCDDIGVNYLTFKPFSQHPKSQPVTAEVDEEYIEEVRKIISDYSGSVKIVLRENALRNSKAPKPYEHCLAAAYFAIITPDGYVWPCAQYIGDKEFSYGDLNFSSWREIMRSGKRAKVLDVLATQDCSACRKPCRLDAANEYLHRIKNRKAHDFFL